MANCVPPSGAIEPGMVTKMGRLKKDPERPKRPQSAYFFYLEDHRPALMGRTPRMSVPDVTRALAEGWRALTEAERRPFVERAEADKQRWKYELGAYEPSAACARRAHAYPPSSSARPRAG